MNNPNPLLPQGSLPQRAKSSLYFKVLMIVAIHTVLIGGILMVGCKDATKDHASTTPPDETTPAVAAAPTSPTTPMTAETPAPTAPTPAPIGTPVAPIANVSPMTPTPMTPAAPIAPVNTTLTPAVAVPTSGGTEYVIKSGDILSTIAKKNSVSLKALQEANPGLDPKKLKIGNKLQIPAATATASSTSSGASVTPAMADANNSAPGDSTIYTVKPGDILAKIAKSHGTTVKHILAANDMKTTLIKAGQKLKMPVMKVASADMTPAAAPAPAISAPTAEPTAAPIAPTGVKAVAN